jgi:hypothetical protein
MGPIGIGCLGYVGVVMDVGKGKVWGYGCEYEDLVQEDHIGEVQVTYLHKLTRIIFKHSKQNEKYKRTNNVTVT